MDSIPNSGNGVLTIVVNGSAWVRRILEIMKSDQHDTDWFTRFERAAEQALDEAEEKYLVKGDGSENSRRVQ